VGHLDRAANFEAGGEALESAVSDLVKKREKFVDTKAAAFLRKRRVEQEEEAELNAMDGGDTDASDDASDNGESDDDAADPSPSGNPRNRDRRSTARGYTARPKTPGNDARLVAIGARAHTNHPISRQKIRFSQPKIRTYRSSSCQVHGRVKPMFV
jgi:hypothetical protein